VVAKFEVEAARFENSDAPETIGPELTSSVGIQSLIDEPETGEEPIKPNRTQ
jgi:hypothetical protein